MNTVYCKRELSIQAYRVTILQTIFQISRTQNCIDNSLTTIKNLKTKLVETETRKIIQHVSCSP